MKRTIITLNAGWSAAYDIVVNKEDVSDSIGEALVKTGVTMLTTHMLVAVAVGVGFISSVAAAPGLVFILGIAGGLVADSMYENDKAGKTVAQGISSVIESAGSVLGFEW